MMASFQLLINVLTDIYQSQQEMIGLAKHKKEVLISGEIDELSKLIQQESSWVKRIGKLEEERISVVNQLIQAKGIDHSSEITITDLINMLSSKTEKEQLKDIHGRLTEALEEIQQLNEINTDLIKQSLDYISNSFELLTGENKQGATYSRPTMKANQNSSRRFFDKKA